ncbi:MAG: CaiB/BaiF CoA-transferase family protein [Gammaproteobacteria bacterium]
MSNAQGPLYGIRILDLSRILAGPYCTQLLGDLGADIVKVERPGVGDDTRTWGPPYVQTVDGDAPQESGYYLCTNRNKRSVTLDISKPTGQELLRALLKKCDVLIENFKVGGLQKYGLAYEQLKGEYSRLVYCSITGFGQTGPYANRPGYDLLAQGLGGIMSVTGESERLPSKIPVAINDIMTGMYSAVAILAALWHRERTGSGQQIDIGLLDTQVAWLANVGLNYLLSGEVPQRLGSAHPNVVPYQVFPSSDGYFILGAGNDEQFRRLSELLGEPNWADDARFATNAARVHNREALIDLISQRTTQHPRDHWLKALEKMGVPCGPVNTIDQVFADPQVDHRQMKITMPHALAADGTVPLIGNPLKLSATPVAHRRAPPELGEHTDEVLEELLNLDTQERQRLRQEGVI